MYFIFIAGMQGTLGATASLFRAHAVSCVKTSVIWHRFLWSFILLSLPEPCAPVHGISLRLAGYLTNLLVLVGWLVQIEFF